MFPFRSSWLGIGAIFGEMACGLRGLGRGFGIDGGTKYIAFIHSDKISLRNDNHLQYLSLHYRMAWPEAGAWSSGFDIIKVNYLVVKLIKVCSR